MNKAMLIIVGILAILAILIALSLSMSSIAGAIILLLILIIALPILLSGFKILKEWERAPVLYLGKYQGLKGPGIVYIPPFIGKIPMIISTRMQVHSFRSEQTLTKDNVPVDIDVVIYYIPVDLTKVVLKVEDFNTATSLAAQTTMREVAGSATLDELLSEREKIAANARQIIDQKTEVWGIKVSNVEIKDILIPASLQEAMSRQAAAERERKARVTLAIAEYEVASKMNDASEVYNKSKYGLQLRWMNILYQIGIQSKASMIFVPSEMMPAGFSQGISPITVMGMQELIAKNQNTEEKKKNNGDLTNQPPDQPMV